MNFQEQNDDGNKKQNFLNINEIESINYSNDAPPVQLYNDINNINNENKNPYDQNKITDSGNEPQNNEKQSFPLFDKPQNQPNFDNRNNLNIPNNDTPNQIYIPSPYTNAENNEPIVIPQYGNIQQNIGINPSPNNYLTNQPFPNNQNPYQVQIPQSNNVTSPPKNQNDCCMCICISCFGIFCVICMLIVGLIYTIFDRITK